MKNTNMIGDNWECKCECVKVQSADPIIVLAFILSIVALGIFGLNTYRDKTRLLVMKQQRCVVK